MRVSRDPAGRELSVVMVAFGSFIANAKYVRESTRDPRTRWDLPFVGAQPARMVIEAILSPSSVKRNRENPFANELRQSPITVIVAPS